MSNTETAHLYFLNRTLSWTISRHRFLADTRDARRARRRAARPLDGFVRHYTPKQWALVSRKTKRKLLEAANFQHPQRV